MTLRTSFAAPATVAVALMMSAIVPMSPSAQASEKGDWMVRLRAIAVLPSPDATVTPIGGGVDIEDQYVPELDITYFLSEKWALELILAVTPHDITHQPTGLDIGEVWLLPPTLTLQYHLQPDHSWFRPYVGVGLNFTTFFDHGDASPLVFDADFDESVGLAFQIGADFPIDEHWSINVDVKKVMIDTDVKLNTALGPIEAEVGIDPLIVGIGLSYRW